MTTRISLPLQPPSAQGSCNGEECAKLGKFSLAERGWGRREGSWDKALGSPGIGSCLRQAPLERSVHQVQPLRLRDLGGRVRHGKHPGHSRERWGLPWGSRGTEGRETPEEEAILRQGQERVPQTLSAPQLQPGQTLLTLSAPLFCVPGPPLVAAEDACEGLAPIDPGAEQAALWPHREGHHGMSPRGAPWGWRGWVSSASRALEDPSPRPDFSILVLPDTA